MVSRQGKLCVPGIKARGGRDLSIIHGMITVFEVEPVRKWPNRRESRGIVIAYYSSMFLGMKKLQ